MKSTRTPARALVGILLGAGLSLGASWGCAPKVVKSEAPMATTDQYASMRDSITKSKPGSLVGQVLTTYQQYAAVTDISPKDVKAGQTIAFVDGAGAPVGNGTVVEPSGESPYLQVKFESSGKRPVQKGDLAVYLKE